MTEYEILILFLSLVIGVFLTYVITRAAKVEFNHEMPNMIKQANRLRLYFLIFLVTSFWSYILLSIFTLLIRNYHV